MYNYNYAIKTEQNNLMRHSNITGIAMLSVAAIGYPLSRLLYFLIQTCFSLSQNQVSEIITGSTFYMYGLNAIITIIMFTIPFIIVSALLKFKISRDSFFGKPQVKGIIFLCIVFALGLTFAGNIASSVFSSFTQSFFGIKPTQTSYATSENQWYTMVIEILLGAALPALIEEFAFRGVLLGIFRRFGDWPAIIASSILFALMHENFVQIPFALFAGFAFGIITVMTRSIWPAVLVHFINNAFAAVAFVAPDIVSVVMIYAIIIAAGFAYSQLKKRGAFNFLISDVPSCLTTSQRTGRLLLSPVMIISILLFLLSALGNFTTV